MESPAQEMLEHMRELGIEWDRDNGIISDGALHAPSYRRASVPRLSLADVFHDLYHARQIVKLHGNDIRYCRKLGGFLVWDGTRWVADEAGTVWRFAIDTTLHIYEKDKETGKNTRTYIRKWALNATRRRNIEDALRHVQAQPEIVATPDMFDRDPWLFTVGNGTIELQTGTLREHRREDLITRLARVEFDPAAAPPERWLQFLDEIFDGNRNVIDFVQRACGYALTGVVSEQKLFFLNGRGSNGKHTFVATLMHVMGEYAVKLSPGLLFTVRRTAHPAAFADLRASRLAVTPKVEFGRRLTGVTVEELTGGDPLTAGRARQDPFEFNPTHKVFMCGNHRPIVRGNEQSIWQRIDLIPFSVTIPEARQDKGLREKLRAEASGILNWLVEGCVAWRKTGLAEPAEITDATRSYRSDMDMLGDFIDECCVLEPGLQETSAALSRAFNRWRLKNGEQPMSRRSFGIELKERGFARKRVGAERVRTWTGIGLRADTTSQNATDTFF